jgi:transcriptional regulator with XRE-family HTH domain
LLGVGRRVAWLRARANLTQESLAAAAHMDLTLVQRIERGDANPTTLVWVDLARALGVEPHQLLKPRREGNPGQRRGPGRPRKKQSGR